MTKTTNLEYDVHYSENALDFYIPELPKGIILKLTNFTPSGWCAKVTGAKNNPYLSRQHTASNPRDAILGALNKLGFK